MKQHTVIGSADIRVVPHTTPISFTPSFPAISFPAIFFSSRINPAIIVLGNQFFIPSLLSLTHHSSFRFRASSKPIASIKMTSFTDWVDEPPVDGKWTNCATLRDHRFFVDLARTNIRLFRDEIPHSTVMRLNLDLEPAPHLDYHLFNVLVSFPERAIGSHNRKTLEYIIDARKDYFRSHEEYRIAFCRLQDAWAYGVILEQDRMQLVNSGTANAKQLENNAIALQKNDVDLAQVYAIAIQKREMRKRLTTAFSQSKESFLKNEASLLVFLGKHLYKRHLEIVNSQGIQSNLQSGRNELIVFKGSLQNERQSSPPAQKSAPSENSNVVPLGSLETEHANVAVMNQQAQRVSPSTVPSDPQLMEPGPSPVIHRHAEPMHQNTINYPSLAAQPVGPFQPAQQVPVEQETNSRANKLLSSSPAPIHPMQLAPMHQRSTLSPQQTATLPPYQPSHATKQQMLKFPTYGPPAPTPAAPELAPAAPMNEAPPPRSALHSASIAISKAPAKAADLTLTSSPHPRPNQKVPVAQMQAYPQPFCQAYPAYPAAAIAPLHPNIPLYSNGIYAGPPNNKLPSHADPSFSPFSATSSMTTSHLAETAPCALAPMQGDREYAPKRSAVYATPYVPMGPKQPMGPRHSTAVSPTISYSRVPVQQKVKTPKPVAPAGGFLSLLLETEMTEKELDEMAARLGPRRRVIDEEASDEMLCDDDA